MVDLVEGAEELGLRERQVKRALEQGLDLPPTLGILREEEPVVVELHRGAARIWVRPDKVEELLKAGWTLSPMT